MIPGRGRQKGSTQELKLVKLFEKWWGNPDATWARSPGSGAWSTINKGKGTLNCEGDITCSDLQFPFTPESKKIEGVSLDQVLLNEKCLIHSWWDQAVGQTPKDKHPFLIFSKNRTKELVVFNKELDLIFGGFWYNLRHFEVHCGNLKDVIVMRLEDFLKLDPKLFKEPSGDRNP